MTIGIAQVRLVDAVFQHRFVVSDAREWRRRHAAALRELFEYAVQHRLDGSENIVLRDEAHLQVELIELARATVGARVLVAKTWRDLEIAVEARHHDAAA